MISRCLIVLIFFFALSLRAEPEIQISRNVKVETQGTIVLGDIATFKDLSPELVSMLNKIEITDFTGTGTKTLTGFQISKILRTAVPPFEEQMAQKIKIKVPALVRINAQLVKVDETTVALMVESELKKMCADCSFRIADLQIPQLNGAAPNSKWTIEYQGSKLPRGGFSVLLRMSDKTHNEKTFWISGHVKIFKKVPVASRTLNIGERIAEGDFMFESRDITLLQDSTPDSSKLIGRQVGHGIPNNEIIIYGALAKELAVKYGQSVKVLSESEWLQISMNAIAQEKGEIGDRVKIMNPSTKAILSAVVEGPGVVRIQ